MATIESHRLSEIGCSMKSNAAMASVTLLNGDSEATESERCKQNKSHTGIFKTKSEPSVKNETKSRQQTRHTHELPVGQPVSAMLAASTIGLLTCQD